MSLIPENPDALLTRDACSAALTAAGYPTASATLATLATRGGGPAFHKYGPRCLYRWKDALEWARAKLSAPRRSTSEPNAGRAA